MCSYVLTYVRMYTRSIYTVYMYISLYFPAIPDPNPILDGRPKVGSVLRLVGGRMSADWDMFAMYLGFEGNTRRTVEMENMRLSHKCFMAVVDWWMQGKHGTGDLPRTWRSVLQAVRDCGHAGLADDVSVSLSGEECVCVRVCVCVCVCVCV